MLAPVAKTQVNGDLVRVAPPPVSRGATGRSANTQANIGNQARLRALQAKLIVGHTNDPLEHEADRAADQVMRMPDPNVAMAAAPVQVGGKCTVCEAGETGKVQAKQADATQAVPDQAPASVDAALRRPGEQLDTITRTFFEPRFGRSLDKVRVHVDQASAASAHGIGARAYAVGNNIVFNAGEYRPTTSEGRYLIAHELAHVLQQTGAAHARSGGQTNPVLVVQRQPVTTKPDAGTPRAAKPAAPFPVTIRLRMDDNVLNPRGSSPKVTMPDELKKLLIRQITAAFAPLNDDSISIVVEWGQFNAKELSTAGNVEVDLIPGAEGAAFDAAQSVAKRYLLSPDDQIKFGVATHEAVGEHWAQSSIPRDMLMGLNVALVPRIFRDRVIQWSGKKATANDKLPAELTIEYVGKSIEHELGHAFGLPDVFNDVAPPGDAGGADQKFPSGRPNVMDILPLPNERPFDEEMDWDELVGPESELGMRRQRAINAIRGPVVLPKRYADKFLNDRTQVKAFNEFSRARVEVLEDGRAVWFPAYDKFEFTKEQLDEMRVFLRGI